jgi:xanthine/CO dehydrogenase XdhC/CoxF family maturation factor
MSATRTIAEALRKTNEPIVLATVIRITGSSYGGVGTRMIIREDQPPIGIVSGGCLESDLAEHAKQVRESGKATVITYDTRADDDAAWGLGLGCNGLIEVLLEPLSTNEARELAAILEKALDADEPSVLATVVNASTAGHALITGATVETMKWNELDLLNSIERDSNDAFAESRGGLVRNYGDTTIAFEVMNPSVKLVICGSGPDVVPLVRLSSDLGWNLTVVDHRPVDKAHAERFPGATVVECNEPGTLGKSVSIGKHTAAVVMSHHYARDLDYMRALIATDAAYIGMLGPRARTERMIADMNASGAVIDPDERLFSPVGLDLGGEGPDAIALAIVAEISAVMSGRVGGHLRNRRAALHAPHPDSTAWTS